MVILEINFDKINYKPKSMGKISSKNKKKVSKLLVKSHACGWEDIIKTKKK